MRRRTFKEEGTEGTGRPDQEVVVGWEWVRKGELDERFEQSRRRNWTGKRGSVSRLDEEKRRTRGAGDTR